MKQIIVVGGGLAGLTSSLVLAKAGFEVLVIERKTYPFHRVCGEYVSYETLPFLQSLGFDPQPFGAAAIHQFQFTSPSGKVLKTPLDLGGFGLSRYCFDNELYHLAQKNGVQFLLGKQVESIDYQEDEFEVKLNDGQELTSELVIGSFGKRSKVDTYLQREFLHKRSPYIGVKYHIRTDFPKDLIALHNFRDGYCGISAIEDDKYCLCYLTTRENLRQSGTIAEMEQKILWRNPHLQKIFSASEFLYDKPEVINEFSFAPKKIVENHVLMAGDAAGLITPLCGNGMALAIQSGKILAEHVTRFLRGEVNRNQLETQYTADWQKHFSRRLWIGRQVQNLFGDEWLSEVATGFFGTFRPALRAVIKATHGSVF